MNIYWWLRPSRIAFLAVMPLAVWAYLAPHNFYHQFGTTNVISDSDFLLVWVSILAFGGAAWIAEMLVPERPEPALQPIPEDVYCNLLYALSAISILAILVFLAPFVEHPSLVMNVLTGVPGASATARLVVNQIPGITSQENLFSVAVVLLMLKRRFTGHGLNSGERVTLFVILLLTSLKVVLHGERLALIELVVPIAILVATQRRRSVFWAIAPLAGTAALFIFFTGTEYLRSWVAYYAARSDSLVGFASSRMAAYYITAFNNGAYVYGQEHSYFFPVQTATWIWRLPIAGLRETLQSISGADVDLAQLLSGQNIEFNNISGVFGPLIDFGPLLGITVWIILGFMSGRLFRRFAEGRPLGLVLYPTWYVGVLEMARIFYWGDTRYFPPLVVSVALSLLFGKLATTPPRPVVGGAARGLSRGPYLRRPLPGGPP